MQTSKSNKYDKLMQKMFEKQINFDKSQDQLDRLLKQNQDVLQQNQVYHKNLLELKDQIFQFQQNETRKAEQLNNELKKLTNKYQDSLKLVKSYEKKIVETEYLITFLKNQQQNKETIQSTMDGVKSILAVDDSAVIRAKMKKMLLGAGYNVTLARDGEEAITFLPKQSFDLIITDLDMPGSNGLEVMHKAAQTEQNKNTPVILITGHEEVKIIIGESESLAGVYRKPWRDSELLNKIKLLFTLTKSIAE